jgi:hypothetical protein
MLAATVLMLQFRSVGFKNFLTGNYEHHESKEQIMFVDYNLYAIGKLVEVFPKYQAYLGMEVPYLALIRPIPRAVWPGKPEGLSASIEEALGMEGLTIAASFAGEAYMAGGTLAVFLIALFFGAITGWWSYLSSSRNSELGILIYASGFFAAVISMRSLFVFTTALMPTVAAIIIGTYAVRKLAAKARQWGNRRASARPSRVPRDHASGDAFHDTTPSIPAPMKVGFVSVVPSPYQRDLFHALSQRPEVELSVSYLEAGAYDAPWPEKPLAAYEKILPGFWLPIGSGRSHFNWRLPSLRQFDVVVMNTSCRSPRRC